MAIDVVVTEPEFVRPNTLFRSRPNIVCHVSPWPEADLAATIARTGARHAIVGPRPYRGALYDALGRGSVLARFGVGYDGIDLAAATARGILCTNTPSVLDQSVAELTMLFIAAAARHLVPLDASMRRREWAPQGGVEIAGKTLAVIGSGRIGAATAHIASAGYGMRVIGCRRSAGQHDPGAPGSGFAFMTNDFAAAVSQADFVALLLPSTPENVHFLNRDRLSLFPPHAWLINTARGIVVDEPALYDALASRQIAGAAIDVFEREPYEPLDATRDLRTLDNVVLVPHIGSNTAEANRGMSDRALRNVELGEARDFAAMDLLNPDALSR